MGVAYSCSSDYQVLPLFSAWGGGISIVFCFFYKFLSLFERSTFSQYFCHSLINLYWKFQLKLLLFIFITLYTYLQQAGILHRDYGEGQRAQYNMPYAIFRTAIQIGLPAHYYFGLIFSTLSISDESPRVNCSSIVQYNYRYLCVIILYVYIYTR